MKESKQFNWNCFGSMFGPPEPVLLMKKKETKDNKSASFRNNKSEDSRQQFQNKPEKKSLKKRRSTSNIATDIQIFQQQLNDDSKSPLQSHLLLPQNQSTSYQPVHHTQHIQSIHYTPNPHSIPHHTFANNIEYRNTAYHQTAIRHEEFPGPNYQEKPIYIHTKQDIFHEIPENFALVNQEKYIASHRKAIGQPKYQNNHISVSNHPSSLKQIQKSATKSYYDDEKSIQISTPARFNEHTSRKNREDFQIVYQKESIIIQDTDRLLKNREEYRSQAILAQNDFMERNKGQSKEKPFGMKRLIMKIANSDDEKDSQSQPSQVIGKGFDKSLNDFWQKDEICHAEETASRSTNPKLSTFYNSKGLMSMNQEGKPKHTFGTSHNFKSYKYL